jgi:hypothetical protein
VAVAKFPSLPEMPTTTFPVVAEAELPSTRTQISTPVKPSPDPVCTALVSDCPPAIVDQRDPQHEQRDDGDRRRPSAHPCV